MYPRRLVFAFFAVAILFSVIHEWRLPVACVRPILTRTNAQQAAK
jgi:hypothetical protein